MYAVIKMAGFQYRVEKGQVVRVPLLAAEEGDTLTVEDVLLVSDGSAIQVGRPNVEGATVSARVIGHGRTPKLVAGKFKRRKMYRRRWGHRQDYTEIEIADIKV